MGTTPAMRKVRSTSFKLRKLPKTKYRMEIESPTFAFISAASQALMRTSPLFKSGYRLVAETKEYGVSELCEPFESRKPFVPCKLFEPRKPRKPRKPCEPFELRKPLKDRSEE